MQEDDRSHAAMTDVPMAGVPSKITSRAENEDSQWETNQLERHQVTEFHRQRCQNSFRSTLRAFGKEEETKIMRREK